MDIVSVTSTDLASRSGRERITSAQSTVYGDEALGGTLSDNAWVLGLGFQHDGLSAPAVQGVGYSYDTPGLFAQDEFSPATWLKFEASSRIDRNNDYGTVFSPRFSALLREPDGVWSLRASIAGGYAAPTPFVDDVEATSLGSVLRLRGLHAERAVTESIDAQWTDQHWDVNVSLFDSSIRDALTVQAADGDKLQIFNAPAGDAKTAGKLLAKHADIRAAINAPRFDFDSPALHRQKIIFPSSPIRSEGITGRSGLVVQAKQRPVDGAHFLDADRHSRHAPAVAAQHSPYP